jgi:NAD(P)-dependent dehydrogenase (short-subunit alcohol dehydrogenase family)
MNHTSESRSALVIGAGGGLGRALLTEWQAEADIDTVIGVSRQPPATSPQALQPGIKWIQSDYSEASISHVCQQLAELDQKTSRVCICNGLLHNDDIWPEKRLEEVQTYVLAQLFHVNAVIPLLWIKSLITQLRGKHECVISVFSARIGSIDDNRSGGWYAYRSSKAALNMLLKTAAIECARRAGNIKLIAFHPGTTDTALSRPFHASVPKDGLFSPRFVARHLVDIMKQQHADGELSFVDWNNEPIAW